MVEGFLYMYPCFAPTLSGHGQAVVRSILSDALVSLLTQLLSLQQSWMGLSTCLLVVYLLLCPPLPSSASHSYPEPLLLLPYFPVP